MGYLWISDLRIKIGSLYGLYMLYMTQVKPGKYKIKMSVGVWREIFAVLDACKESAPDVFAVLNKLQETQAICLHASISIIPPPTSMPESKPSDDLARKLGGKSGKLQLDTIGDDALDLAALEAADAQYRTYLGNAPTILSKTLIEDLGKLKEEAKLRIEQLDNTATFPFGLPNLVPTLSSSRDSRAINPASASSMSSSHTR